MVDKMGHQKKKTGRYMSALGTFAVVVTFINEDNTDSHAYIVDEYMCGDFCRDVIKNAESKKMRCGDVFISEFGSSYFGSNHGIVVFDTMDAGLVFVEPQMDFIISNEAFDGMLDDGWYFVETEYYFLEMNFAYYEIDWFENFDDWKFQQTWNTYKIKNNLK